MIIRDKNHLLSIIMNYKCLLLIIFMFNDQKQIIIHIHLKYLLFINHYYYFPFCLKNFIIIIIHL